LFFYHEIGLPELALIQTALSLGRQIGLFLLRKQAESNVSLRNRALEASNEAVFITRCGSHTNLIEYVNPAFEKISGYSEEMVLGMDLMSVQQKLCRDQSLQEIKDALQEKRAGHCIMHNYRADGSRFWSDLHIAPVYAENLIQDDWHNDLQSGQHNEKK